MLGLPSSMLVALFVFRMAQAAYPAPANDNLNTASVLAGESVQVHATNADATKEVGEPNHGANLGGKSVWWRWTAPRSGSVRLTTRGSTFDTLLAAYIGSTYANLSLVSGNDDSGREITSAVAFNVDSGVSYAIAVDGFSGAAGEIQLAVTFREARLTRALNDNFANRLPLRGTNAAASGANFLASKEPAEPNHANELGGASVWWAWTAPVSGTIIIDTAGSEIDTLLGVYTGTALTNLVLVARNDDISTNQPASQVRFAASAGMEYQIAVDAFAGEQGEIRLQITLADLLRLGIQLDRASQQLALTAFAAPGQTAEIEASSDLSSWIKTGTRLDPGGTLKLAAPGVGSPARQFYRAVQAQAP